MLSRAGTTRVLAFGGPAEGVPVLLVPSLINRATILDLSAKRSFARYLRDRGLRPYLVDWGKPGAVERAFGLDDYILGAPRRRADGDPPRRRPAGGPARLLHGRPAGPAPRIALRRLRAGPARDALGLPCRRRRPGAPRRGRHAGADRPYRRPRPASGRCDTGHVLPCSIRSSPRASSAPSRRSRPLPPRRATSVALEDWLNDGVPLAGPVALACLGAWYGANAPARGAWRVGGAVIRPQRIGVPALNVVPARDRIVPPASAEALSTALPAVETWRPALGHIGMMASPRAKRLLWRRLADWMTARAAIDRH